MIDRVIEPLKPAAAWAHSRCRSAFAPSMNSWTGEAATKEDRVRHRQIALSFLTA
jgi:hypothetical protein